MIGHPIEHSLSPAIANAAFAEMGIDWAAVAFDVPEGGGAAAIAGAAALGLRGLSVTMPHKDVAAATVDALTPAAAALGAVNCVAIEAGTTTGHNTDGDGFVASLRAEAHVDPAGLVCAVVGAGGAARSIIRALTDAGATEVLVVNRTASSAHRAAEVAPGSARVASAADLADAAVVVNATSVGMADPQRPEQQAALPFDPATLRPGTLVADVVYHPRRTALLSAAEAAGLPTLGGLGMLVHQAAVALEIWTRTPPPIEAMTAAAEAALAARHAAAGS